jgi:hypothetical protein
MEDTTAAGGDATAHGSPDRQRDASYGRNWVMAA